MKSYTVHFINCDKILKNIGSKQLHNVNARDWLSIEIEGDNELKGILMALESEGLIIWPDKTNFYISGTIKGFQFKEDGGFEEKIKQENIKEQYAIDLHKSTVNTNKWMRTLTIILALSAFLTSIVQIVQCRISNRQLNKELQQGGLSPKNSVAGTVILDAEHLRTNHVCPDVTKPLSDSTKSKLNDTTALKQNTVNKKNKPD